jgi:tetratricopeptide (TPR) repeat protein
VLGELWSNGQLAPSDGASVRRTQHLLATAHADVGRLDEAIAIAGNALDGIPPGEGRSARAELESWQGDYQVLAAAYARDGHYRREPGRVVEGLAHGPPLVGADVAMAIDAFISVGKEEMAWLCYAHHEGAGRADTPTAWLAGAKAALCAGDLGRAVELLDRATLTGGAARIDSAVNRVLRLAATRAPEEWEKILAQRLDAGAVTLARLLARDLADFVPGLAGSEVVAEALGPRAARPFAEAWLAPLRSALAGVPLGDIDALFAEHSAPTLAAADRLAGGWPARISASLPDEGRVCQLVHLFGQAVCRYLALTTGAPNPLAGGLRQVATDALTLLGQGRPPPLGALRSILEAFDGAGVGVDPWVLDRWLLRFERAVLLEGRVGGNLRSFTTGLGLVGDHLRGEERVAFELRLAHELKDDGDPTNDDQARVLFERSLRAIGTGAVAVGYAEVTSTLDPEATRDVCFTAAAAEPHRHPGPHLALARALFAAGQPDRALDALVVGLPLLDTTAREQRLAELRPHWERAGFGFPFEWAAAQDEGLAHLRAGRNEEAMRCFRWCNALDPSNAGMLKNLGLACAALGRTAAAIAAFSEMDEGDGPRLAGQALLQAQRYGHAVFALRYASLSFTTAADWAALGGAAWYDEDDETAAEAYEKVYTLKRGRLDAGELSTFATALANAGLFARCEDVARELIAAALDDPPFLAHGNHAMARGLLGQGRFSEAVPFAQLALNGNPLADAANEFAETLARAQRGEPYAVTPLRSATAPARAFAALTAGDMQAALSIAGSAPGWPTARAALAAAAWRADDQMPVSPGALRFIVDELDRSAGETGRDATLWRLLALELVEAAYFPVDTPPPLGARVSPADFARQLEDRLEEEEPTIMKEVPTLRMPQPPPPPTDDLIVFPGTKIPRLSDYVQVMKAMQGQDPLGALAELGIDMAAYAKLASQWARRLASDPVLSARFSQQMDQ